MRKFTKTFFVCSLLFIALSACDKEKRIERSLYKKTGEWKVTNYKYIQYKDDVIENDLSIASFGTMEFQKGGKIGWKVDVGNSYDQSVGSWSNTENKLTINFDNTPIEYDIIDRSNKEMSLTNTRNMDISGSTYRFETSMDLERKK